MTDIKDRAARSYNMSRIRSKDTKPELTVRKYLFAQGFRYRLHDKKLPGKPDIVLPKYKTVIFVNGCFWHRHADCIYSTVPATNKNKWEKKFMENVNRDEKAIADLSRNGWRVIVIWECQIKNLDAVTDQIHRGFNEKI